MTRRSKMPISWISLRFPKEMEEAYWAASRNWMLFALRFFTCALTGFLVVSYAVAAIQIGHDMMVPAVRLTLQLGFVGLLTFLASSYHPLFIRHVGLASVALVGGALAIMLSAYVFSRPDSKPLALQYMSLLLVAMSGLPVPFLRRIVILAVGCCTLAVARSIVEPTGHVLQRAQDVATFCFIVAVSYLSELGLRRVFFLQTCLEEERDRADHLLRNIFPEPIFLKVRDLVRPTFVEGFADVSILFADIVGFTQFAAGKPPTEVVKMLDELVSRLDASCAQVGALKIKTIGDAYMAATGLPDADPDHVFKVAELALDFREAVAKYSALTGIKIQVRIGIHSGPVVAGIIGRKTSHFDIWGDAVNVAARLEAISIPGEIQVSESLAKRLEERYELKARGMVQLKGREAVNTYFLGKPKMATAEVIETHAAA